MNMKGKIFAVWMVLTMGVVLPVLGAFLAGNRMETPESPTETTVISEAGTEAAEPEKPTEETIMVPNVSVLKDDGTVSSVKLDDYLTGVLLAEMPVEFEPEALKAQAVVSATYALRRGKVQDKHGGAVCLHSGCCQGYRDPEAYVREGGSQADVEKNRDAVKAVTGQVLTYDGELIEATFFSCTGGSTEAAVEVWGGDVPYLQAMPSPGEEIAVHYKDEQIFSREELEEKLGVSLGEDSAGWFDQMRFTKGGGVRSAEVGGEEFTGVELRQKLGLRSTDFSVTPMDDQVCLTTHGFGHRVGMSQYGAQAMALAGNNYVQILTHYYQGAEVTQIDKDGQIG